MLITRAPFRVSFFGGGTDFYDYYSVYGGQVRSTTIDKYCHVMMRSLPPFFDYRNQATYSVIERFNSPREARHPLIRAALQYIPTDRILINYDGDLPARSGIGSSSSFAVALLRGLHRMHGQAVDRMTLAKEAIYLEREMYNESGGVQDQLAAAFGGLNFITMTADGFDVRPVPMPADNKTRLQDNLILAFTGMTRLSGLVAEEQQNNIKDKTAVLHEMKAMADDALQLLTDARCPARSRPTRSTRSTDRCCAQAPTAESSWARAAAGICSSTSRPNSAGSSARSSRPSALCRLRLRIPASASYLTAARNR